VNVRSIIFRGLLAALCAAFMVIGAAPVRAQQDSARIEQMLKETGFKFTTHNPTTWSIDFDRKNLGKFKVIMSTGSDILVTFAILAKKANINKSPKMMDTLLSANHEYDYVKVGLDKDGDMFVRIDTLMRTLDSRALKDVINQVANASEEVFIKIAGSVKK
jgi:hypothetical protein